MSKLKILLCINFILFILSTAAFSQKEKKLQAQVPSDNQITQQQTTNTPSVTIAPEEQPFAVLAYTTNLTFFPPLQSAIHIDYIYPSGGILPHTINLAPGEFVADLDLAVDKTNKIIHLLVKVTDTAVFWISANASLKYYRIPYNNWPSVVTPTTIPTGFTDNILKEDLAVASNGITYVAVYHFGATYWDPADLQLVQILGRRQRLLFWQ